MQAKGLTMLALSPNFQPLTDEAVHPNGWRALIAVCGANEACQNFDLWRPTHLISIYGPASRYLGPAELPAERHLHLRIDDTMIEGIAAAPSAWMVEDIFNFVDRLPADARLVIHCRQGISRSTGVALGILARYLPPEAAGDSLLALRPMAMPNRLIARLFDQRLRLDGQLLKVAERICA